MTELRINTKKESIRKFLSWFLTVCLCLSMGYTEVWAADKTAVRSDETKESSFKTGYERTLAGSSADDGQGSTTDDGRQDSSSDDGVTGVSLDSQLISMKKGESVTIKAVVQPAGAKDKSVIWITSNPDVAVVENGKITATGAGTAVITVLTNDGGYMAFCSVSVTENGNVTGVKLNKKSITLNKGKSQTLKAVVSPKTASNKKLTWSTSNKKVATVKNGKVTAKKVGTAVIKVKTKEGGFTASCKVTVNLPVSGISFDRETIYVAKGKSVKLAASIVPEDTTDTLTWSTSNKKVVTVKNGKITGEMEGQAKVSVKTSSGKKATVNVVVLDKEVASDSIMLDRKDITLFVGKKLTLGATMSPANSTDTIKWTSSNKKVASVTSSGRVTIKQAGTATITARTSSGKTETCRITVPGVVLRKNSATIKVKKTVQIKVKFSTIVGDKVKSYKSSDKDVATVTKKGKVKGKEEGTATITVTMNSGATAKFKVRVKE